VHNDQVFYPGPTHESSHSAKIKKQIRDDGAARYYMICKAKSKLWLIPQPSQAWDVNLKGKHSTLT